MDYIEFKVEGMDEIIKRASRTDTIGMITVNEGLRAISKLIIPILRMNTPKVTGKLARSTVGEILGQLNNQRLEIRQAAMSPEGVFYGFIVREGRGPVYAKKAKALHFFIGDKEFFRKSVGPAEPNPYHQRTIDSLMPEIQEIVYRMGVNIAAYLSGKSNL
jgi:hypothetical protein